MRASLICCGPRVGQASNFCGQTQGAYAGIMCGGLTIGTLSGLTRCALSDHNSVAVQLRGELRTLFGVTSMLPDDTPQAVVACIVELGLMPSKVAMGHGWL